MARWTEGDDGTHPEGCLSFSNACEAATVRGTTIRPARTAISSNAWRLDVSDVVVEPTEDEPDWADERGRRGDETPVVRGVTVDSARPGRRGASFVRLDLHDSADVD